MTVDIPVLVGARLRLAPFEARHFEAYHQALSDPKVSAYIGDGKPLDRYRAFSSMASMIGHWALKGFGLWAVEDLATGAWIGRIGLFFPEGWPEMELGYLLVPSCWGKGLATEGARLAMQYARTVLGRDRLVSYIRPDNVNSRRVAERLGGRLEGDVEIMGATSVRYAYDLRSLS